MISNVRIKLSRNIYLTKSYAYTLQEWFHITSDSKQIINCSSAVNNTKGSELHWTSYSSHILTTNLTGVSSPTSERRHCLHTHVSTPNTIHKWKLNYMTEKLQKCSYLQRHNFLVGRVTANIWRSEMNDDATTDLFQYLFAGPGFANDCNSPRPRSQEQDVEK